MVNKIISELCVNDGNKVILYDRLDKECFFSQEQCARNIYLVNVNSKIIWQIYSDYDFEGNPFTSIRADNAGDITAYRWDGGLYVIDKNTGFAKPHQLIK